MTDNGPLRQKLREELTITPPGADWSHTAIPHHNRDTKVGTLKIRKSARVCNDRWEGLIDDTSLAEVAFFTLVFTSKPRSEKTGNKPKNEIAPSHPVDDGNDAAVHSTLCLSF